MAQIPNLDNSAINLTSLRDQSQKELINILKNVKSKEPEPEQDEVYQIPSLNGDCSKGMKMWIMEYHQNRPGLNILQQRIDDNITTHEEQEKQAKKEREAHLVEGGWTVVAHHKEGKKQQMLKVEPLWALLP